MPLETGFVLRLQHKMKKKPAKYKKNIYDLFMRLTWCVCISAVFFVGLEQWTAQPKTHHFHSIKSQMLFGNLFIVFRFTMQILCKFFNKFSARLINSIIVGLSFWLSIVLSLDQLELFYTLVRQWLCFSLF